jgi:hypothetical protein
MEIRELSHDIEITLWQSFFLTQKEAMTYSCFIKQTDKWSFLLFVVASFIDCATTVHHQLELRTIMNVEVRSKSFRNQLDQEHFTMDVKLNCF